jgi:hypothetical protein
MSSLSGHRLDTSFPRTDMAFENQMLAVRCPLGVKRLPGISLERDLLLGAGHFSGLLIDAQEEEMTFRSIPAFRREYDPFPIG